MLAMNIHVKVFFICGQQQLIKFFSVIVSVLSASFKVKLK